jgi:septum site-determining protein MinD
MKNIPFSSNSHLLFVNYCFIIYVHILRKGGASMGEVIAILSGKGGTGKTSVCAGIATALAELDASVLCIDCDMGLRNLDLSLGMSHHGTLNFLDVCQRGYDLNHATEHPEYPNLRFLTAPINIPAGGVDLSGFYAMLCAAREEFDYILLDAPAGVEAGFRLTARHADRMLLVTGADPAAIRDAGHTGELLELMGKLQIRLIVNRVNKRMLKAMGITVDDIMDQAGLPLLGVVPEDMKVTLAAAAGQPLLDFAPRSAASAACRRIAKRIKGIRVPISI